LEKITYPLLCYQISPDAVLGILIGTDYQTVEKDIPSLKNVLSNHIQQKYKKQNDYWRKKNNYMH